MTPVGEIAIYCKHDKNAIIVNNPEEPFQAIDYLLSLLKNKKGYHQLQNAAINTWTGSPLYKDDFCLAAFELMNTI